jgi:hypothetical protein
MAIYNREIRYISGGGGTTSGTYEERFGLAENPIYGGIRIGNFNRNLLLGGFGFSSISGYTSGGTIIMAGVTSLNKETLLQKIYIDQNNGLLKYFKDKINSIR